MNVFEAVKQNLTTRQAAEMYGIHVNHNGMAICPFHKDRNPSLKVDTRFHCFACQADGDVVDFASRLYKLPSKEAAIKLADDAGIAYDISEVPASRQQIRAPPAKNERQPDEERYEKIFIKYFQMLRDWSRQYAPKHRGEEWNPLFVEALKKESYVEYLINVLLYGTDEEKKALIAERENEVLQMEKRIAELIAKQENENNSS